MRRAMTAAERQRGRRHRLDLGGRKLDVTEARIAELEVRVKELAAEFAKWAARARRERKQVWRKR